MCVGRVHGLHFFLKTSSQYNENHCHSKWNLVLLWVTLPDKSMQLTLASAFRETRTQITNHATTQQSIDVSDNKKGNQTRTQITTHTNNQPHKQTNTHTHQQKHTHNQPNKMINTFNLRVPQMENEPGATLDPWTPPQINVFNIFKMTKMTKSTILNI